MSNAAIALKTAGTSNPIKQMEIKISNVDGVPQIEITNSLGNGPTSQFTYHGPYDHPMDTSSPDGIFYDFSISCDVNAMSVFFNGQFLHTFYVTHPVVNQLLWNQKTSGSLYVLVTRIEYTESKAQYSTSKISISCN